MGYGGACRPQWAMGCCVDCGFGCKVPIQLIIDCGRTAVPELLVRSMVVVEGKVRILSSGDLILVRTGTHSDLCKR